MFTLMRTLGKHVHYVFVLNESYTKSAPRHTTAPTDRQASRQADRQADKQTQIMNDRDMHRYVQNGIQTDSDRISNKYNCIGRHCTDSARTEHRYTDRRRQKDRNAQGLTETDSERQ